MQASSAAGGLVARAANRHLAKDGREASGVCSAAQRHTHFLDSPRMTAVMARSDFDFAALKDSQMAGKPRNPRPINKTVDLSDAKSHKVQTPNGTGRRRGAIPLRVLLARECATTAATAVGH